MILLLGKGRKESCFTFYPAGTFQKKNPFKKYGENLTTESFFFLFFLSVSTGFSKVSA